MATWCLTKQAAENFRNALKNGEINPFIMADMTSQERRDFIGTYVGEENAKQVNALYESKLLLKNKVTGYKTWAKKVSGITPKVRADLLSRIEKMDKVLSPKEEQAFLEDLASARLGIEITQQEAKTINDLSEKSVELRKKADEAGVFSSKNERLQYGAAQVDLENYINDLKIKSRSISFKERPVGKMVEAVKETPGALKSFNASLDNSFFGRQGIKTLLDYKTSRLWLKNFRKSFSDIGKVLANQDAIQAIKADIYSRPNALNGKYKAGGYGLDVLSEEAFPSSLPEKIPVLGKLFKASEQAYNGAALRLRADLADRYIKLAEENGINMNNKEEAQPLGNVIGSLTGRGDLGKLNVIASEANALFYSIKFLKSNIDTIFAPLTYYTNVALEKGGEVRFKNKGQKFAQKQAAYSTLRILATLASFYTIAGLLDPERVDTDPRSSNFGKIKINGLWTDITGGMGPLVTLMARIAPTYHNGKWSQWRKTSTGQWVDTRAGGYGSSDAYDLLINGLFTNKLAPFARVIVDAMRGEMFGGDPFTVEKALANATIPLTIQSYSDLQRNPQASWVLGTMMLEGLGFSSSSYVPSTSWDKSTGKELTAFREKVGEKKFKEANEAFNQAYAMWYGQVIASDGYKKLSDDAKQDLLSKGKEKIKDKIFKQYKFKYKQNRKSEQQKREVNKLLPK